MAKINQLSLHIVYQCFTLKRICDKISLPEITGIN